VCNANGLAQRATPKGLRIEAQGCCTQLPWENRNKWPNPNGVVAKAPGLQPASARDGFAEMRSLVSSSHHTYHGAATPLGLRGSTPPFSPR
jgi:hypothetical protein